MVQYREGEIIIGVLASTHHRGQGSKTCSQVWSLGFQEIEAINLVIDMVS